LGLTPQSKKLMFGVGWAAFYQMHVSRARSRKSALENSLQLALSAEKGGRELERAVLKNFGPL